MLEGDPAALPELAELKAVVAAEHGEHTPATQPSSIEDWAETIEAMLEAGAGPTAIYDRLRLDERFEGSLGAVKRLCRGRARPRVSQPRMWSSPSRLFDQKIETSLRCHAEAFAELGGVPKMIVTDNLEVAVTRASFAVDGSTVLNRSDREFARFFGFQVVSDVAGVHGDGGTVCAQIDGSEQYVFAAPTSHGDFLNIPLANGSGTGVFVNLVRSTNSNGAWEWTPDLDLIPTDVIDDLRHIQASSFDAEIGLEWFTARTVVAVLDHLRELIVDLAHMQLDIHQQRQSTQYAGLTSAAPPAIDISTTSRPYCLACSMPTSSVRGVSTGHVVTTYGAMKVDVSGDRDALAILSEAA